MLEFEQTVDGVVVRGVRAGTADGELLDDVLVTRFAALGGFVRVAVFDPAQNHLLPDSRRLAHRAASVARSWMAAEPDPLIALAGANAELRALAPDPTLAPTTTTVWADVVVTGDGRLRVLGAGRAGDGVCAEVTSSGVQLRHLLVEPMLTELGAKRWAAVTADAAEVRRGGYAWDAYRWMRRSQAFVGGDWHHPAVGGAATIAPELVDSETVDALCVATDGFELPEADVAWCGFDRHVDALANRTTPAAGHRYPHGDIAALYVTADPLDAEFDFTYDDIAGSSTAGRPHLHLVTD